MPRVGVVAGRLSSLPPPVVEDVNRFLVVRDDLLPGGTKRRVLTGGLDGYSAGSREYVYASPAYGYAQVALAYACRDAGYRATIFTAKRDVAHPLTVEAHRLGATVYMVPMGFLSVCEARARDYAAERGAVLIPCGIDTDYFRGRLTAVAKSLDVNPAEVWTVTATGMLSRSLQEAWPDATFYGVEVGKRPDLGSATSYRAPEKFDRPAKSPPPFPSCPNYDAKAWQFVVRHAKPGALFWNVAA